jgi:hypothetical protein
MLAFQPGESAPPQVPGPAAGAGAAGRGRTNHRAPPAGMGSGTVIDAASWAGIVEAAQLSGMVRQFALNCVPVSFEQNVLKLSLDSAAGDRRTQQIEDKLAQALSKLLGRDVRLAFETLAAEVITPARQRLQAEQDKAERAVASFEQDPAVRGLRERFGATVDPASVKPTT